MKQIFIKEINSFLNSQIAYLVVTVFLSATGVYLWLVPSSGVIEFGFADLSTLFALGPNVFLFLIPAITMRTIAEERKTGTIELLMTKPVHDWEIIFGKFFASFSLVIFALVPTLLYVVTIYYLGNPVGNLDAAGIAGSYIGLLMLGAVFTSIGLFASSISDSQITSFIIALFFCFVLHYGFETLAGINVWGTFSVLVSQLGIAHHYNAMSKGLIDSRDVLYFLSVIGIMLMATRLVLGSRKW